LNNQEKNSIKEIRLENEKIQPDDKFITYRDLIRIVKVALILSISLIFPGYLYIAGLQLGWALALFIGFIFVGWLGYSIKR
jgi:hypothetical protein